MTHPTHSEGRGGKPVKHEWQPIETAPRDESWILLTGGKIDYGWDGDEPPTMVVGQSTGDRNGMQVESHWQFAWYDSGYYGEYEKPTHWMPLPPPPSMKPSKN